MPRWAMECDCLLPTRNGAVDHGGFFLGVRVGMHSSRHVLSASLHASYRILGRETTVHSLLQTARVQPVAVGAWCVYVCVISGLSIFADSDFRCVWTYTLRRVRMTHESVRAFRLCWRAGRVSVPRVHVRTMLESGVRRVRPGEV